MFGLPGGMEWILIVAVILIFFGGKKIPELMKGLGSGIKEFKKASTTEDKPDEKKKIDENK
ncbi:MAG: twin-arginine translocase TatA/TatE family subunit [Candidatus Kapabacteria bacterium]|jgi:sec-independent protein translocase protein TatA|nr:twin-arginine translocase TatA/TatE family subunit [Candidatus Kapabacteria bacterium]